jgi:hypothetical protein
VQNGSCRGLSIEAFADLEPSSAWRASHFRLFTVVQESATVAAGPQFDFSYVSNVDQIRDNPVS